MSTELKPCQFCGLKPEYAWRVKQLNFKHYCKVNDKLRLDFWMMDGVDFAKGWNSRTPSPKEAMFPELVAQCEQLKQLRAFFHQPDNGVHDLLTRAKELLK